MAASKGSGKTVRINVGVWFDPKSGHIHLASAEAGIISTVSNDPNSKRYQPNLYRKLRRVLVDSGKWPN
jgi:hypothetical protein